MESAGSKMGYGRGKGDWFSYFAKAKMREIASLN
jgi:hypothetical protein